MNTAGGSTKSDPTILNSFVTLFRSFRSSCKMTNMKYKVCSTQKKSNFTSRMVSFTISVYLWKSVKIMQPRVWFRLCLESTFEKENAFTCSGRNYFSFAVYLVFNNSFIICIQIHVSLLSVSIDNSQRVSSQQRLPKHMRLLYIAFETSWFSLSLSEICGFNVQPSRNNT